MSPTETSGNQVVLITGASAGFGKACAEQAGKNSVYQDAAKRALGIMEEAEKNGPPPDELAYSLEKILRHPSPNLRYPVGKISDRFATKLKDFIPAKLFEWLTMKVYKLI